MPMPMPVYFPIVEGKDAQVPIHRTLFRLASLWGKAELHAEYIATR